MCLFWFLLPDCHQFPNLMGVLLPTVSAKILRDFLFVTMWMFHRKKCRSGKNSSLVSQHFNEYWGNLKAIFVEQNLIIYYWTLLEDTGDRLRNKDTQKQTNFISFSTVHFFCLALGKYLTASSSSHSILHIIDPF